MGMFAVEIDASVLAFAATVAVALIGWMSTRSTDTSKMQGDYMREINADNNELRTRVDDLEERNRELEKHVARCDTDNDSLRQRVSSLEAILRRVLGDDVDGLSGL